MLGRVTAIMRFPSFCAIPLGALLAGALGTFLSIRATLWIMFVIYASSGPFLIFSTVRHDKNLPAGRSTARPAAGAVIDRQRHDAGLMKEQGAVDSLT